MLTGFAGSPRGECVDKKGDVFITVLAPAKSQASNIVEYAHGGTMPINTFSDEWGPIGCSVDPTTGNLAVTNAGNVAIYPSGESKPNYYTIPSFADISYCGYDDVGNLFVSGTYSRGQIALAELPKGSSNFTDINVSGFGGKYAADLGNNVQWDGKDLAYGYYYDTQQPPYIIYRLKVTGSTAQIVGTTPLEGVSAFVSQFFISGGSVIVPIAFQFHAVKFYLYPAGGKAVKKITKHVAGVQGVVLSRAPH
jgi:phage terminase large subunit-like protein